MRGPVRKVGQSDSEGIESITLALIGRGHCRSPPTTGPSLFPSESLCFGVSIWILISAATNHLRKMATDSDSRVRAPWMFYESYIYSSFLKIDSMPWAEAPCHLATISVDRKYLSGWFTALQSFWLKRLFLKRLVKISPWSGLFKAAKLWISLVSFIVGMIWWGGRWGAGGREKEEEALD